MLQTFGALTNKQASDTNNNKKKKKTSKLQQRNSRIVNFTGLHFYEVRNTRIYSDLYLCQHQKTDIDNSFTT